MLGDATAKTYQRQNGHMREWVCIAMQVGDKSNEWCSPAEMGALAL